MHEKRVREEKEQLQFPFLKFIYIYITLREKELI